MLDACAETPIWSKTDWIEDVKPSTATLISMVASLISQVVEGRSGYSDGALLGRLAVRCLLDDGYIAGTVLKPFTNNWMATFEKCLRNAAAAGDLGEYPTTPHLCAWLLHHIALGLMLHASSRNPIDYKVPKHTVIRETVRFALRGVGLKGRADQPSLQFEVHMRGREMMSRPNFLDLTVSEQTLRCLGQARFKFNSVPRSGVQCSPFETPRKEPVPSPSAALRINFVEGRLLRANGRKKTRKHVLSCVEGSEHRTRDSEVLP